MIKFFLIVGVVWTQRCGLNKKVWFEQKGMVWNKRVWFEHKGCGLNTKGVVWTKRVLFEQKGCCLVWVEQKGVIWTKRVRFEQKGCGLNKKGVVWTKRLWFEQKGCGLNKKGVWFGCGQFCKPPLEKSVYMPLKCISTLRRWPWFTMQWSWHVVTSDYHSKCTISGHHHKNYPLIYSAWHLLSPLNIAKFTGS
jgi:hypothetical protein